MRLPRVAAPVVALGGLLLVAGGVLLVEGRHFTFFFDEWTWILHRRTGSIDDYLAPHNGHFSLVPVLIYKFLFATAGMRHYTPYRVVAVGLHLSCCALLYVLARRRVGPWLALVPAVLLAFMGTAFEDLLWPFQMGYLASIAGGLSALALLDVPGRRHDALAALSLTLAVASSGIGIAFLAAAAVMVLALPGDWRRLWLVALPAALFALWYLTWGQPEHITATAALGMPRYVADSAAAASAAIAGLSYAQWGPIAVVAVVAAMATAWSRAGGTRPTPLLLAALAGALAFWGLTALTRFESADPTVNRYLYVGAVFIWLLAAEAKLGVGLKPTWMALTALGVLAALIGNARVLRDGARGLLYTDTNVQAALTAVQVAAPVESPGFIPLRKLAPPIRAGLYLRAARDLGSPAFTVAELEHQSTQLRDRADGVLVRAERLTPVSGTPACPPGRSPSSDLRIPPDGTLVVKTAASGPPATVSLRRFSPAFDLPPFWTIGRGQAVSIRFPADRAPGLAWHVRVAAATPAMVCVAPATP